MKSKRYPIGPLPVLLLLTLAACGGEDPAPGAGAVSAVIPESFWVASAPSGARTVVDVRGKAPAGEDVVVTGRVKDFIAGRAVFTLIDTGLQSCREREGDACPTPWDYCCEAPETIASNTLTVEIRGPDGRPLKSGLQGYHGLEHLDLVTLTGEVSRDPQGNVTLSLASLHRE